MTLRTREWWLSRRAFLVSGAAALALGCPRPQDNEREILLAAAASLRGTLPDVISAFGASFPGTRVAATYGASGDLRKQVEGGAPIDGVLFASASPVDDLIKAGRADAASRRVLATNQLVLIAPKSGQKRGEPKTEASAAGSAAPPAAGTPAPLTFATLDSAPPGEMIAIGDPGAVPAGQYARDYLQKLGMWDKLQGRLVLGGDVADVLAYARRGEAAAAIVYRTDVHGIGDVTLLDEAKGELAPRAEIVAATVKGAASEAGAKKFLDFASSADGQRIFAQHGFGPP
jgi:molybdate transport system substrate-binding protein